jgi:cell division protein FtsL
LNTRGQATRQASWRSQLRSTGVVILILAAFLIIGAMYLAVNNKVAQVGRHVLDLEAQRDQLLRDNSALQAELALVASPQKMMERARGMGFRPAQPQEVEYLVVDGYHPPDPFVAPRPPAGSGEVSTMLSPAFTETLGDWLARALAGQAGR